MRVQALLGLPAASMWHYCRVVLIGLLLPVLGTLAGYALHGADPPLGSRPAMWCGLVDFALAGHVYNATVAQTHKLCWLACTQQLRCVSANFRAHGDQAGRCELSYLTHSMEPSSLHAKPGWIYTYAQHKRGSCASEPELYNNAANNTWPVGMYGLPMPTSGCPTSRGFTWETGYCLYDTDESNPHNEWSSPLHLKGSHSLNDMSEHYCMKTVDRLSECEQEWPLGEYCVYKFGYHCPTNMSPGSSIWTGINNHTVNGTVPSGQYNGSFRMDYCCMTGGSASQPITLPTHIPFYLFPYTSQCQEVQGMNASQEWLWWDISEEPESASNASGSHPYMQNDQNSKVYFCFYNKLF